MCTGNSHGQSLTSRVLGTGLDIASVSPSSLKGNFLRVFLNDENIFCFLFAKINAALMSENLNITLYFHFFRPDICHPEQQSQHIRSRAGDTARDGVSAAMRPWTRSPAKKEEKENGGREKYPQIQIGQCTPVPLFSQA